MTPDPERLAEVEGRHTAALRYSRWERLVFHVTGRWPQRVVERRLIADELDRAEARILQRWWTGSGLSGGER